MKHISSKTVLAFVALMAAIVLSLASFWQTNDITTNMLLLVAQFLMYSLTMMGFGEIVKYITKTLRRDAQP